MNVVIPPAIDKYFAEHPVIKSQPGRYFANPKIIQEFMPGKGWQRAEWNKHVSFNHVRKLQRKGVTAVTLVVPGPDTPGPADFAIDEILNSK